MVARRRTNGLTHHPPTDPPTLDLSWLTHLPVAEVDHGLDGEDVAGLHGAFGLVLGVVRHGGVGVEKLPDAVPAVGAHHRAARRRRDLKDEE